MILCAICQKEIESSIAPKHYGGESFHFECLEEEIREARANAIETEYIISHQKCCLCGHEKRYHHPVFGCEIERGDGYIGGVLQALGPCACGAKRERM